MQAGGFSDESLSSYQSLLRGCSESLWDLEGVYDFTRCVRPDGSTYGTKGRCSPPNKPIAEEPQEGSSTTKELPGPDIKEAIVSMGNYKAKVNVNTKGII